MDTSVKTLNWRFQCEACGFTGSPEQPLWQCPDCSGELHIEGLEHQAGASSEAGNGIWKFADVLPVSPPSAGTILGEGNTPLVPFELDGVEIYLKLDSLLPTGSFKDRGAAVLTRYLEQIGVRRLIVDSSGNAASAISGYAAALGLECSVYIPASASPGKLAQARAYGANVIPVEGSREDVANAAQSAARSDDSASYAGHNWHPVFVEGVKTWALEVSEQLGNQNPDAVFVPTGGGSAFVGAARGFADASGLMPRLIACQPAACAPIVRAWERNAPIEQVTPGTTIAEGTRIALPSRPNQIMQAIETSNGNAIAVDEETLLDTLKLLWSRGFYVEPTAALGVAACRMAIKHGQVERNATIVALITGHGLKTGGVE